MSKEGDYATIVADICKTYTGENKWNCLQVAFDCIEVEYNYEDIIDFIQTRCDVNDDNIKIFLDYYLDLMR